MADQSLASVSSVTDQPHYATPKRGGRATGSGRPLSLRGERLGPALVHASDGACAKRARSARIVRGAAEATESKALAYLVKLLIEDEQRHHRLFAELAASLKSEAEMQPAEPIVPRMDFDRVDPGRPTRSD